MQRQFSEEDGRTCSWAIQMRLRPTWSALPPSPLMTQPFAGAQWFMGQCLIDLAQCLPFRQQIHNYATVAQWWSYRLWCRCMLQSARLHFNKKFAFAGFCAVMRRLVIPWHCASCHPLLDSTSNLGTHIWAVINERASVNTFLRTSFAICHCPAVRKIWAVHWSGLCDSLRQCLQSCLPKVSLNHDRGALEPSFGNQRV